MDKDSKLSLLMYSLVNFYNNQENFINEIKDIVDQKSVVSLRILDWFITNYSKKYKTVIVNNEGEKIDVYINYKLMLKSFSKTQFDPFCRKNKIFFEYAEDEQGNTKGIETSCGQLCFFRWCFQNNILEYVKKNFEKIETDMKNCLKNKSNADKSKKRQPLSISASRSLSKQTVKYVVRFD
jgi:hypothetical protein